MATINGTGGNDREGSATGPINGTGSADLIDGLAGNDQIYGGGGNDSIAGSEGRDEVRGGVGEDDLFGGSGNDWLLGGADNDYLQGNAGNDTLEGGLGDDIMFGADGQDTLFGGNGNDHLGAGGDGETVYGGNGIDTYGNVQVYDVSINLGTGQGAGGDRLYGIENITGGYGNDQLVGDAGANRITAYIGKDRLEGGGGADVLSGGGSSGPADGDLFVFASTSDSTVAARDRILDFDDPLLISGTKTFLMPVDRIDLSAIDAKAGVGGNQAFTFIGTDSFNGTGQVRYAVDGDHTFIEANTTGDTTPEMLIELSGSHLMVGVDFIL
jgi:Ca2+-binding RTX toxin-like protein